MSFPPSLSTRTVTGRFVTFPDGVGAKGTVRLILENYMQGPADRAFIAPFDKTIRLDGHGSFSAIVPANNDPQWTPSRYRVVITIEDATEPLRSSFDVPHNGSDPLDLAVILNVPPIIPGESYILTASKGVPGGVASLGSDGKLIPEQMPAVSVTDIAWSNVTGKPTTFPPESHTHSFVDLTGKPLTYAPSAHEHGVTDVTGLSDQLSTINNTLSQKANASAVVTALGNKADLVDGVLATSQIPAISVVEYLGSVSSQSAMLALTGEKGDFALRSDLGQHWIITGPNPTQISSWTAVPIGTVAVQSVNGQTGIIVLGKSDVGLGNVDNTSDNAKPISSLQQAALDLKASIAAMEAGDAGVAYTANLAYDQSEAAIAAVAGKADAAAVTVALSGKADTSHSHSISQVTNLLAALSGFIAPSDHGFAGWTYPSDDIQSATILPTAGLSYIVRIRLTASTVSAICLHVTTAGSGLSNTYATLHTDAGVLLSGAVTADQSTYLSSGGLKTMNLVTPQSGLTIGAWCKVRFWVGAATTMPTVTRKANSSSQIINANLSAPNFRYGTADSGLTTLAGAPTTIGTITGGPTAWWVALAQ